MTKLPLGDGNFIDIMAVSQQNDSVPALKLCNRYKTLTLTLSNAPEFRLIAP